MIVFTCCLLFAAKSGMSDKSDKLGKLDKSTTLDKVDQLVKLDKSYKLDTLSSVCCVCWISPIS